LDFWLTKVLTPYASAILLDPEYGLPAAKHRSKNAGLLLAYAKIKLDVVILGMEEFSKDKYGVDVLKIEIPIDVKYLNLFNQ